VFASLSAEAANASSRREQACGDMVAPEAKLLCGHVFVADRFAGSSETIG